MPASGRVTLAALCVATLAVVGCSGTTPVDVSAATTTTTAPLDLGVTDSRLAEMRGLRPGAALRESFRDRVIAAEPGARGLSGAAEAYDATMLAAVAAEQARSDGSGRVAADLGSVSQQGEACSTFKRCRELARTTTDLDYEGQSGAIEFLDNGDPGEARFELVSFGSDGTLDAETEIVTRPRPLATLPPPADPTFGRPADGTLRIGTLLPINGPNPEVARAAQAGVRLAIDDINAEGGVLGVPVELLPDETGDGSASATLGAVERLVAQRADVVIGGTDFSIDSIAIGPLVAEGVVLISPSDRNRGLSAIPDRGLFFRTIAPDDVEARSLAELPINDGYLKLALVVASSGAEFEQAADISAEFQALQGEIVVSAVLDPGGDAAGVINQVIGSGAEAVVLALPIAETAAAINAMIARGASPAEFPTYGVAASMNTELVRLTGNR